MGIIYGLIDSDTLELRYIGQTVNARKRLNQHRVAGHCSPHLDNWLRATHWNMITIECNPTDLNQAEQDWIYIMRTLGARLLNLADGGNGSYERTVEHRARISTGTRAGMTLEVRARMSVSMVGNRNACGKHKNRNMLSENSTKG